MNHRIALVAPVLALLCACSSASQSGDGASLQLAITNVPNDVSCIRLTLASAANGTVQRSFDVAHGASTVLSVPDLPPGAMTFSADAFPTACSAVTATTVGSWVSNKQTVTLVAGIPSFVTLTMARNGEACVSVDFPTDGFSGDAGTTAPTGPTTTITSAPLGTTTATSAAFTFASSASDSLFQCSLDGAAWATCTSPASYAGLASGAHTFSVRSVSPTCAFGAPVSQTWTIADTASIPLSFSVPANTEVTKCAVVAVGNATARLVRNARIQLSPGAQEAAIYRVAGPASAAADCTMFAGLSANQHMLMLGDRPDTKLAFPNTSAGSPVGFSLPASAFLKIELHANNTTTAAMTTSATITLDSITPPADAVIADLSLSAITAINIAPNATSTASQFTPGIASKSTFAMAMHSHQFLTGAKASSAVSATDPAATQLYTDNTWANPPLTSFSPALAMTAGRGYAYQCSWTNTTSSNVTFGMSSASEQCMLLQWYYPAAGFQFCADSTCSMIP